MWKRSGKICNFITFTILFLLIFGDSRNGRTGPYIMDISPWIMDRFPFVLKMLDVLPKFLTISEARLHKISSQRVLNQLNRPRIVRPIKDITVIKGQTAVLECIIEGLGVNPGTTSPIPYRVAWFKVDSQTIISFHDRLVTRDPRINVTVEGGLKVWKLHIGSVDEKDRGHYMCQINTIPMTRSMGYLDVYVPPHIVERGTSRDLTVMEHTNVNFTCAAAGHPMPKISWVIMNGIRPESHPIYYYYKRITESVLNGAESSVPEYMIPLNSGGADDKINPNIVGRYVIEKAGKLRPNHKKFRNNSSTWIKDDKVEHSQRPSQPVKPQRNTSSDDFQVFSILGQDRFLFIPSAKRQHMGTYICLAENGIQPSVSRQIELYVKFPPTMINAKQHSAMQQQITALQGQILNTTLRCLASSYPIPMYITWYHEGLKINPIVNGRIAIRHKQLNLTFTESVLTIYDIKPQDSGKYKCTFNNTVGSDHHTIDLDVKADPLTTQIVDRSKLLFKDNDQKYAEFPNKYIAPSYNEISTSSTGLNGQKNDVTNVSQIKKKGPSAIRSGSPTSITYQIIQSIYLNLIPCHIIYLIISTYVTG